MGIVKYSGVIQSLGELSSLVGGLRDLSNVLCRKVVVLLLGFLLGEEFLLSFLVVLGQIAVLAHAGRVVGLLWMAASPGHLALSLPVVTVVAHVLSVVLSVWVGAGVNLLASSLRGDELQVLR